MRRLSSAVTVAVMMTALGPLESTAQRGRSGSRGPAAGVPGEGVELVMRLRDRLDLTEIQLEQLEEIRRQSVARRSAARAEMQDLHSRMRAGELEGGVMPDLMAERREQVEATVEEHRELLSQILTAEQQEQLEELRREGRSLRRGSPSRGSMGPRGRALRRHRDSHGRGGFAPRFRGPRRMDGALPGPMGRRWRW